MQLMETAFGPFFPGTTRRAIVFPPVGFIPMAASLPSLLKPGGLVDEDTHQS